MPNPAIPAYSIRPNHRIDTTDYYSLEFYFLHYREYNNHKNQIKYPPGHSPCGQKANTGRRKSGIGFSAVFFLCIFGKGHLFVPGFTAK